MSSPYKSVYFVGDNKDYITNQADKENISFNKKINDLIEADKEKAEKKEKEN